MGSLFAYVNVFVLSLVSVVERLYTHTHTHTHTHKIQFVPRSKHSVSILKASQC